MNTLGSTLLAGLAVVSICAACGTSSDGQSTGSASGNIGGGDSGAGTTSSGASGGTSGIGGTSGGTSGTTSGDPQPIDDGGACAAQNADTQRKPAYLFFILDQSSSMDKPACYYTNPQCFDSGPKPTCCTESEKPKRWTPITQALKAFVQDPLSKGITAGLELFPSVPGGSSTPPAFCNASTYATDIASMDVPMRPLPDPGGTTFSSKWPETPTGLGTPTRAVFKAMGPIVKKWAQEHTDGKTAIVLLTDGYPQQCSDDDNKIANVAAEISAIKDVVPTYVIGVSDKKENLDDLTALAIAGGTTLTRVDTTDPAKTQKEFLDTINLIRKSTFSCDVAIPAAPAGQTLDLAKVNVNFTSGKGVKEALAYDATCTGTKGWRFDSTTEPKKIELCTATCDTFEDDPDGKLGVEFGCQRRDVEVVK